MIKKFNMFESFDFSYLDEMEEIYDKAKDDLVEACIDEIVEIARNKQEDGVYDYFYMAMGSTIYEKDGQSVDVDEDIEEIINRFDYLKLTGYPVKVVLDEPLERD